MVHGEEPVAGPRWRAAAGALRYRIGRRGAALLAFAFIDIVLAWTLSDPETKAMTKSLPTYRAASEVAPLEVWAALWLVIGLLCLVQAFALVNDRIAFTCAIGIKIAWGGAFAASWIFYGAPRGWLAATTWLVVAALVAVIAGWPEPVRRPPPAWRKERP